MATPAVRNIRQALEEAAGLLAALADPRREAEWLLMDTLPCSRAWLFSHADQALDEDGYQRFLDRVGRRAAGEPLAYVLGHCVFRELTLAVSPAVLIPRPETEWLVEEVLQQLPAGPLLVAELGTGSGAIALSLARERPRWQVWASDISASALDVARHNAAALQLEQVRFLQGDWFEALPAGQYFDVVVSNPPYVESGSPVLDEAVAHHEPALALYAGQHGMAALRHLIVEAAARLRTAGLLALEHGHDQGAPVREQMRTVGYSDITTHRDLGGHERFTVARWGEQSHA